MQTTTPCQDESPWRNRCESPLEGFGKAVLKGTRRNPSPQRPQIPSNESCKCQTSINHTRGILTKNCRIILDHNPNFFLSSLNQIWYFVTKIVLVIKMTRTIYSNSERSGKFLVTESFFNFSWRFLRSNRLEKLWFKLEKNNWGLETCRKTHEKFIILNIMRNAFWV